VPGRRGVGHRNRQKELEAREPAISFAPTNGWPNSIWIVFTTFGSGKMPPQNPLYLPPFPGYELILPLLFLFSVDPSLPSEEEERHSTNGRGADIGAAPMNVT